MSESTVILRQTPASFFFHFIFSADVHTPRMPIKSVTGLRPRREAKRLRSVLSWESCVGNIFIEILFPDGISAHTRVLVPPTSAYKLTKDSLQHRFDLALTESESGEPGVLAAQKFFVVGIAQE